MFNPYQMQPQYPPSMSPFAPYGAFPGKQMPAPQPAGPQIEGVRWVSGIDEVNGTVIGFGKAAVFMFSNENAFAIKSVDPTGVPTVKVFDFTERPPANQTVLDPGQYVTKEEFDELRRKYEQLAQQPAAAADPVAPAELGSSQHHADDAVVPGNPAAGAGSVLQPGGVYGMDAVPAQ